MNENGILSKDEMDVVRQSLLDANVKGCQSCSGSQRLDIVNQVVAMRSASTVIENEVTFVAVQCSNCKTVRLYPTKDVGISRDKAAAGQ